LDITAPAGAGRRKLVRTGRTTPGCGDVPARLQFSVAEPLASSATLAESVILASSAAVVALVFSPVGKTMETASIVKPMVAVTKLLATEVAVTVAGQLTFSDDSEGGV
jgi:hypothetical protein